MAVNPKKIVLSCALSGATTPKGNVPGGNPNVPVTVEEVAAEAKRAYDAGASIVHLHARDPKTGDSYPGGQMQENTQTFIDMIAAIKAICPELIINCTTGGGIGQTLEERLDPIIKCKPPVASFTSGPLTFGLYSKSQGKFIFDVSNALTFEAMKHYADTFRECGTKAECEVYDFGHLNMLATIRDSFKEKLLIQFVMGMPGQAMRATVTTLFRAYEQANEVLGEGTFLWGTVGVGLAQWPILATSASLGATNMRCGFEDNIYIEPGVLANSNGQLVEKAVKIARSVNREIASVEETKEILGLK